MAIRFNADEVFAMAIKAEQNGAAFYRRAAELHQNEADCAFLLQLAAMEDEHRKVFGEMRDKLSGQAKDAGTFDPDGQGSLYLGALADASAGEGAPDVAAQMSGQESLAEIIKTAIGLEKQAILFYLGLRDLVPENLGRGEVDAIIREEKGHVVTLSAELKKVR